MCGRLNDLKHFYEILSSLETKTGVRKLSDEDWNRDLPQRGVYFFMEDDQKRSNSSEGLRIVRVGTHALGHNANTTLERRLRQHKGNGNGRGNTRASIFRKLVGLAYRNKSEQHKKYVTNNEISLESEVSKIIGNMPFLWLDVDGVGGHELRKYIELNSIALLSNHNKAEKLDYSTGDWLGFYTKKPKVVSSGLWNQQLVGRNYEPMFLEKLASLIKSMNQSIKK